MKNILICIVLVFSSLTCKRGNKNVNQKFDSNKPLDSSFKIDELEIKDSIFYLKASKDKNGEISLKYRLKHTNIDRDMCFRYFDYSDVVFPDLSVGLIDSHSFKESRYYLVRDSILILPLIGMNNSLSVYILNLQSQQMIISDIRTSFNLLWVNERSSTFLVTDTPVYINDTIYLYKLNKYKLEENTVSLIKTDTVHLHIDLKDNLKINYLIARRILN
jgi:hypothetical protein